MPCALQSFRLTIVPTVRGIVQRVAGLPVVPPGCSWRGAHLLLVVTLELIHDHGVAKVTRRQGSAFA
jgi:hypothetical protein